MPSEGSESLRGRPVPVSGASGRSAVSRSSAAPLLFVLAFVVLAGMRGDGAVAQTACALQVRPAVTIEVSRTRWPHVADHIADVRRHYHRVLHIDRAGADANRDASLDGFPTRTGYDRDEYPPAMSDEGGDGANVRYVPSSENRSQGSVMGNQLEPYCNGSHFRLIAVP